MYIHFRQRGFTIVSAIFLLVVLSVLGAMILVVSTTQSTTSAQDVQGSRAYHAARVGLEWGLYQVLDPLNTTVVPPGVGWPSMPGCAATPVGTPLAIEGFSVTVACTSSDYTEGATQSIRVYQLTATAVRPGLVVGSLDYVERQMQVSASMCRDTGGVAPDYACP
jgi:MSHA biogenesis protein MshP